MEGITNISEESNNTEICNSADSSSISGDDNDSVPSNMLNQDPTVSSVSSDGDIDSLIISVGGFHNLSLEEVISTTIGITKISEKEQILMKKIDQMHPKF